MESGSSASGIIVDGAVRNSNSQNSNENSQKKFFVVFAFAFFIGILSIGCIIVWSFSGENAGFSWSQPKKKFNYHPLFHTIGLIFLVGQSMCCYQFLFIIKIHYHLLPIFIQKYQERINFTRA